MNDEQDLIKQAQAGEITAFESLYDLHYKPIYTYIYYRVGQRELAEDLTSDVFERMVGKIDTWKPGTKPFIAWLYTIAGNLVRNHVKRQKHIRWLPLEEEVDKQQSPTLENESGIMAQISRKLQRESVAKALTQLTEDQRQVIILRFIQGLPIANVAEMLGKPITSIKALQRRAIGSLKRELEVEGNHV
ncbi:MAG: sigma-70 family RNA polymerase sigma factor [Chloroflexota bacterium]